MKEAKNKINFQFWRFVKKLFKEHASLCVIVLGGGGFLLSNIILKELLSASDYGFYSMVVTYLSLIYIYGLLGFEQVFLRFSHQINKNTIQTNKIQINYIIVLSLITTFVFFCGFKIYFQNEITFSSLLLFGASFCSIFALFLFNVFRLNNNFVLSQFIGNGWRIFLFALSVIFFVFKRNDLSDFVNVLLIFVILTTVLFGFYLLKNISFVFVKELSTKNTFHSFFNFFISITGISVLLFGDRFIIESKLGMEVFGDYFYLTSLVLSPFTILQNYVGFKQLISFKKNFSKDIFINFNKKIGLFSIGLSFAIAVFVLILTYSDFLNFDFSLYTSSIVLLLVLGIVRLYSSSILAAFEAQTNLKTLKFANIINIISVILISLIIVYVCSSLNQIIVGFIAVWTLRNFVLRQLLLRQVRIEN